MNHKEASTTIPLSPEESYEASQLFGRSLFSALQLAKERERIKMQERANMFQDDGTLRIPIPESMLPVRDKLAEDPIEGEELHVAKAPLSILGGIAGGGAGAALRNQSRGFMHGTKRTLQGGLLGAAAGLGGGALLDSLINEKIKQRADGSLEWREKARASALAQMEKEERLRQLQEDLNAPPEKLAYDEESSGIIARALRSSNEPLRMLSGGQEGFATAKRDYYMQEREKIQKELMHAQKEYIDTLAKIKTGEAQTETPCVDAFCNGIAHATLFGKTADFQEPEIEDGAIRRLLGDTLGVVKKPFQPALDTAATGLVGTAAGGAYLTYLLRKKMREEPENYMSESLPTRVELEPYA
jgi:hypothetical protein